MADEKKKYVKLKYLGSKSPRDEGAEDHFHGHDHVLGLPVHVKKGATVTVSEEYADRMSEDHPDWFSVGGATTAKDDDDDKKSKK
jgi:hypothetical protein